MFYCQLMFFFAARCGASQWHPAGRVPSKTGPDDQPIGGKVF